MHFSSSVHFTGFPSYYTSAAAMSEGQIKTGSAHGNSRLLLINNASSTTDPVDDMCLLQPYEYLPGLCYPPYNSQEHPAMNMDESGNAKQQLSYV